MFSSLRRTASVAVRKAAAPCTRRCVAKLSTRSAAAATSSTVQRPVRAVQVARRRVPVSRRTMMAPAFSPSRVLRAEAESLDGITIETKFDHKYDNAGVETLAAELQQRRKDDPYLTAPNKDANSQVYFDINIAGKPAGRVVIEVREDISPKAAENFKALATGSGKLSYKGTKIYEWFSGYYVNGGDVTNNNGTGGDSIYGGDFVGEQTDAPMGLGSVHLLASKMDSTEVMLGKRDLVNSKFSILMIDLPSVMAGQGVLVGQVLKGMEVLEDVQANPVTQSNNFFKPGVEVTIAACGEVPAAEKIKQEDFKDKAE